MWRIDRRRWSIITHARIDARDQVAQKWHEGISEADVSWEQKNAVWVPTALLLERGYSGVETYEIEIEWSSVNEELDEMLFTPEALTLKPGGVVADARLDGKLVVIEKLGDRGVQSVTDIQVVEKRSSQRIYWIVGVNVILIVAVIALLFRRRCMGT
jgi:hypothetical protein